MCNGVFALVLSGNFYTFESIKITGRSIDVTDAIDG
jgi:hypothetical protein